MGASDPTMGTPDASMSAGMAPGPAPGMETMSFEGMPPGGMAPGMAPGMNPGMPGFPGGMPGQPAFVDPAPPEEADYLSKAKYAFAIGKEKVGEQYLIAELLSNDATAQGLLQQIRWSPGAKRPSSTIRFAVGVDLKAPSAIQDYRPIGRTQFAQQANQGGGMGGGSEMGMPGGGGPGGSSGQGAQKTFGDLTGRFGEELVKSFESAWDNGSFGTVFKDVETIEPVNRAAQGFNNGMGGMNGMMMSSEGGMPGGFAPGMAPGMGAAGQPAAPTDAAARMRATPGKVIVPGLLYLGTGNQSELAGKAETEGVDFIFLFDVDVKPGRMLVNDTRLKLISVKDQAPLGATSTLNNNKVDKDMALKGDSDDVAKQLTNLFRKVDTIKLTDMPKIPTAAAQARIKSLIEKKPKDILPVLMEIKLFHSLGSLSDEDRDGAYQLAAGGNGIAFSKGTAEDREFVLNPLLPAYK